MSEFSELNRIARQLRDKEEYFSTNKLECLQAFIRDGGNCSYCHTYLFKSYDMASATDHLIPRKRLKKDSRLELMWDIRNLVACCAECNQIKRDFDPSEGEGFSSFDELLSEPNKRKKLISKAHERIEKKKKDVNWASAFERGKARFREAVEEYHRSQPASAA